MLTVTTIISVIFTSSSSSSSCCFESHSMGVPISGVNSFTPAKQVEDRNIKKTILGSIMQKYYPSCELVIFPKHSCTG
jgi:hypothetical protein